MKTQSKESEKILVKHVSDKEGVNIQKIGDLV